MKMSSPDSKSFKHSVLANEKGMAFVTTILLLLVLGLLVTVSTQWSAMDIKRTANYTKTREAFFIADAGLQDVINHMNYDSTGASPGAAADHVDDALNSLPAAYGTGISYQNGTYTVVVSDNDDGDATAGVDDDFTVIANATGTKNGRTSRIQAILHLPRAQGDAAILSENPLITSGNGHIAGGNAAVHSNSSATLGGNVTVTGGGTAVGTCNPGSTGITCDSGPQYEREIPRLFPKDYKEYARYIMQGDGDILDKGADLTDPADDVLYTLNGGVWEDPSNTPPSPNPLIFASFTHNGGQGWSATNVVAGGNAPNNAFFYFEDGFRGVGSIGSLGAEWNATIISEEDIQINGNAFINNCTTNPDCGTDEAILNLFLIAGDDLDTPNLDAPNITGVMAALDQFRVGGEATLTGTIIGNNFDGDYKGDTYSSTNSNIVNSINNTVIGNMSLTYNGPVVLPVVERKVRILTWKELALNETF
jgi:Tfp pilus assembly protein PilX